MDLNAITDQQLSHMHRAAVAAAKGHAEDLSDLAVRVLDAAVAGDFKTWHDLNEQFMAKHAATLARQAHADELFAEIERRTGMQDRELVESRLFGASDDRIED